MIPAAVVAAGSALAWHDAPTARAGRAGGGPVRAAA